MIQNNETFVSATPLDQIGRLPPVETVRKLVLGILQAKEWTEVEPPNAYSYYPNNAHVSRLAALTALQCLPERNAWWNFSEFERALFERIGEYHSIAGVESRPSFYRETPAEKHAQLEKWQTEIRTGWEKNDVPWLQAMLQSWMYAFGLVEIEWAKGIVERFRLTDLGCALFWNVPLQEQTQLAENQTTAWIVQPNFEMVVFLENASMEQMAFLEQYAERVQISQHTAQYKLTRDSIYDGLQRRGSADQLLEGLAAGSRVGVPDNVAFEIRNWADLRERIKVRKHADLIEFADEAERRHAITQGFQGQPVADRFLLVPENDQPSRAILKIIDYSQKPDLGALYVSEEGVIVQDTTLPDLVTPSFLDLWAERKNSFAWRLTRPSVEQAMQRGRKLSELQNFLEERTKGSIPGILLIALKAWTGSPRQASFAAVALLQCNRPDLLEALLQSRKLAPHILGRIGADGILVKTADADAVKAVLEWAGIQTSTKLTGF